MAPTRRLVIPLVIFLVAIAAIWSTIVATDTKPRLGLDLRGGTSVIYQPVPAPGTQVTSTALDTTVDIIRARVNAQGVAESEVNVEGGNIVVSIPDVRDPDQVIAAVGTTAQLRFRPVLEEVAPSSPNYKKGAFAAADCAKPDPALDDPAKEVVLCVREPGQQAVATDATKLRMGPVALQGRDITDATAELTQSGSQGITTGQWDTALQMSGDGGKKFAKLTGDLAGKQGAQRQIAITLDGVVINHPPVAEDVKAGEGITGGRATINGQTEQEAKALAPLISTGALPLSLKFLTRDTVSATLGNESLRAGLLAGAVGLGIVLLYILLFYRALGPIVWVGLLCSSALNIGMIFLLGRWIGFTLTLAGIAGLIVAIGISADSYIVFFERLKDEVREGRRLRSAIDHGWRRGFRTLIAADIISFLAALVLYLLAIGPVRGFAFTLGLATIIDVITAWFFTRPVVNLLGRTRLFREGRFGLAATAGVDQLPTSGRPAAGARA